VNLLNPMERRIELLNSRKGSIMMKYKPQENHMGKNINKEH